MNENINNKLIDPNEINNNEEMIPLNENNKDKEKRNLIKVLQNVEEKLNNEMNMKDNNDTQNISSGNNSNKYKRKTNICILCADNQEKRFYNYGLKILFSFYLPFFVILNLVGIFLILSIMNVLFVAIKRALICYFELDDKDDKSYYDFYNFYSYYFDESAKGGIDFDLIEILGFLGLILVKSMGFGASSFLLMLFNSLSLFLIINFYDEYNHTFEKYSKYQILYLIFCYILLFIGVGCSALLSQQILIDNYEKYCSFLYILQKEKEKKNDEKENLESYEEFLRQTQKLFSKEKKEEFFQKMLKSYSYYYNKEEEKQKGDYFLLICITSVFGFIIKYIINIHILYIKHNFDKKYNLSDFEYIYDINNNTTDTNANDNEINNIIFSNDRKLFIIISSIYSGCILISLFFYIFFNCVYDNDDENTEKEEKKEYSKCQIFGYLLFIEKAYYDVNGNFVTKKIEIESQKEVKRGIGRATKLMGAEEQRQKEIQKEEQKKICKKIGKCIKKFCKILCLYLKLLSDSFKSCFNEILCKFCGCGENCHCCCCCECCKCCDKVSENDYELNKGYFCFCYKSKRHVKWFNRFIRNDAQIKILPLLSEFFLVQLNTIAFEIKYEEIEEDKEDNELYDSKNIIIFLIFFLGSFLLFFYLIFTFGQISLYLSKNNEQLKENYKSKPLFEKLTNRALKGRYGIIIFNGFYSLIVSYMCLIKEIDNNNYFYIPIFLNKFYYFEFAHQCTVYTDIEEGIDIFSFATLLSLYLKGWDLFIFLLNFLPLKVLLYFQIVISVFIILVYLSMISIFICCLGKFLLICLSFFSLFPCGWCWIFECYDKHNHDEKNIKCQHEECIIEYINKCSCCCCYCRNFLKTLHYIEDENNL